MRVCGVCVGCGSVRVGVWVWVGVCACLFACLLFDTMNGKAEKQSPKVILG